MALALALAAMSVGCDAAATSGCDDDGYSWHAAAAATNDKKKEESEGRARIFVQQQVKQQTDITLWLMSLR